MALYYHMIIVFFSTSTTRTSVKDTHFVLALTPAFYFRHYGPSRRTEGYADAFHSCLDVEGSADAEQTPPTSKFKNTDPRIVCYNRQVSSTMLLCLDLLSVVSVEASIMAVVLVTTELCCLMVFVEGSFDSQHR